MARKRIPGADRRSLILAAAKTVFAERGFEGAKTLQIAAAAKVSEALVYRHFPSKLALYRAVLRQLIREQDENFDRLGLPEPSTHSLIWTIENYLRTSLEQQGTVQTESTRIMFASLAADAGYARLVYRRAMRLMRSPIERALEAAREAGDLTGDAISPLNASLFVEHVGSMISVSRLHGTPVVPYAGDDEALLHDSIWFCARGIGVKEDAIRRYFSGSTAVKKSSAAPRKRRTPPAKASPVSG